MNTSIERSSNRAGEKMFDGFRHFVDRAEEFVSTSADRSAESLDAAQIRFQDSLVKAKALLADAQSRATDKALAATERTERYISDNPWRTVAIVGLLGLVGGLLVSSRGGGTDRRDQ